MFKKTLPLAGIAILRFLGLFIVLPVISIYATSFQASPLMLGLAVGGAYLTQVIFQTPIGIASDRYDRKKVVFIGLLIFMIGSIICALAHNIELLVIGRLIQGAGAVGGVVSAHITDLVREEERTKAMAIIGGGIFISFTLAMLTGPIIGAHFGVDKLFGITAILTLLSIVLLYTNVPNAPKITYSFKNKHPYWRETFGDKNLWIVNISSFLEKAMMTLIFVVIPLALINHFNFLEEDLWKIYTPGAIIGVLAMAPATIIAEKYGKSKVVMFYGVAMFLLAYICIAIADFDPKSTKIWLFILGIMIFFIGFASLEPIMQSLASKYAKAYQRGAVMGIFTTYGYVGSFVGGTAGGILYHFMGIEKLAILVVCICVIWIILISFLQNPAKQKNIYLPLELYDTNKFKTLNDFDGIIEWYVNESENIIIVKYNSDKYAQKDILKLSEEFKN